ETYILQSLFSAEREIEGRFVFLYADIIFERGILEKLLKSRGDIVLVVDRAWYDNRRNGIEPPTSKAKPALVKTKRPPIPGYRFLPPEGEDTVVRIGHDLDPDEAHGEFIGMAMFSERGAEILREAYHRSLERYRDKRFHEADTFERASFTDMIQELIDLGYEVSCVEIYKGWMEINTFEDYRRAWAELRE
ncbi:MAG: phosphoenolpyruvate mutase, partial [Candidatus Methylomirabilales bacterium]